MARKYDHEYKVQAVKLAKEIGGAKAAKEYNFPASFPSWERGLKQHTCDGQLKIKCRSPRGNVD